MKTQQDGFSLAELLVVIAIIGILAALLLSILIQTPGPGRSIQCQRNLAEIHRSIQSYRASNESAPPAEGGSEASSWGMFLKDNGRGEGTLHNELFFCPIQARTDNFKEEDYASDDGDYMFNLLTEDGISPLSSDADPETILAADCVASDGNDSNHGDPAKKPIYVVLKNSAVMSVRKGDRLFERVRKAGMVGGAHTENPHCPSPESPTDDEKRPQVEQKNQKDPSGNSEK